MNHPVRRTCRHVAVRWPKAGLPSAPVSGGNVTATNCLRRQLTCRSEIQAVTREFTMAMLIENGVGDKDLTAYERANIDRRSAAFRDTRPGTEEVGENRQTGEIPSD